MSALEPARATPFPSAPPREPRHLCCWAGEALASGRAHEALTAWEEAGKPSENDPAVAVSVALLEAEVRRWDSVLRRAQGVLSRAHENPLAGGLAGIAASQTGEWSVAAELLARHGLFASYPLVRLFVRAFAGEVRGHPEEYPWPGTASPAQTADASLPPVRPSLWSRLVQGGGFGPDAACRALIVEGDKALLRSDLEEAVRCFQAAVSQGPENWMARLAVGLCHLELGQTEIAVAELVELLANRPEIPNAAAAAAWALTHRGEYRRALEILATLTPAGPDDWGLHYIAALCLHGLGREAEADTMLRQALGPYFLDTWEQFVMPLFHRVAASLQSRAATPGRGAPGERRLDE